MINEAMRLPVVAGSFYPEDKEKLIDLIRSCFLSKFGPGHMPGKKEKGVSAVIVPHAGYFYSGPCAAFAYKAISESINPDLFVLLGPSHSGFMSCVSLQDWVTPMGVVKADRDFGRKFIANSGLLQDSDAHKNEHSIEVQLPFLQFIVDNPLILPVMIAENCDYKKVADALKKTVAETGKKIIIICSSDFTHLGSNYGFVPFHKRVKENMHALDAGAIDKIRAVSPEGFLDYIDKTKATICGRWPIAVLLHYLKKSDVRLLKYYTSADITESEYDTAVGYASIEFR